LTPQFSQLEELYKEYKDKGLEILGFPCNQFKNQDPGSNTEIKNFCQLNYGVTFNMFEKIDVNGENAHPLYKFLKSETKGFLNSEIKWNFTKFLIDSEGKVVKRYAPTTAPMKIKSDIKNLLK
jgi:glutathione peroxidase